MRISITLTTEAVERLRALGGQADGTTSGASAVASRIIYDALRIEQPADYHQNKAAAAAAKEKQ